MPSTIDRDTVERRLRELMADAGFEKYKDLAESLEIRQSTLSLHIKKLVEFGAFDNDFFERLAVKLALPESALRAEMFDVTPRMYEDEILDFIDSLHSGDQYYYITSQRPIEFRSQSFRDILVDKMGAGVLFNYVFPDLTDNYMLKKYSQFENSTPRETMCLPDDFIEFMAKYMRHVNVPAIESKLCAWKCKDPFICNPLFNVMLLQRREASGRFRYTAYVDYTQANQSRSTEERRWFMLTDGDAELILQGVRDKERTTPIQWDEYHVD